MEAEEFRAAKIELLKAAGDTESAEQFNGEYQRLICLLAPGLAAVDTEARALARARVEALRRIARAQVRYLAQQRRQAMADDLSALTEDEFIKA